jgi:hypothetical protein
MFPEFFEHDNLKSFKWFAKRMREASLQWPGEGGQEDSSPVTPLVEETAGAQITGAGAQLFPEFLEFDGESSIDKEASADKEEGDKDGAEEDDEQKKDGFMLFKF